MIEYTTELTEVEIDGLEEEHCKKCQYHRINCNGATRCNLSMNDFCQLCCCNNLCEKYDPKTSPCYPMRRVFLCIIVNPERTCEEVK